MSDVEHSELSVQDYSDKAIVVRGDTKEHKENLKKLGGKYNPSLRDGDSRSPGWIFSKKCEANVLEYVSSGKITAPDWGSSKTETKTTSKTAKTVKRTSPEVQKTQIDTSGLNDVIGLLKKLTKKVEGLEKSLDFLIRTQQTTEVDPTSSSDEDEVPHRRLLK